MPTKKVSPAPRNSTQVVIPDLTLEGILEHFSASLRREKKSPRRPLRDSGREVGVFSKGGKNSETKSGSRRDFELIPVTVLAHEKSRRARYFLDSQKHPAKFWMVMIDVTLGGCLPTATNKPCWWCRHTFSSAPIGCPVNYYPHKDSGVEKERFEECLLAANLISKKQLVVSSKNGGMTNDFFETEGYFCSWPCAKAYVLDISPGLSIRYKDSLGLISLMFSKVCGDVMKNGEVVIQEIPIAPSWKVLKEYGGHLTIQEFRATFGQLTYEPSINYVRPFMFSSSQYIAEKKEKARIATV